MPDPGPLPRIHPRENLVRQAERDLDEAFDEVCKKHGLTYGEKLRIACGVFARYVGDVAKYMIRDERHGDAARPGGAT
jgi:hypothetical protein